MTHRVQGYIRRNTHNIVKLEWAQRCIADKRLHPWRPSDMFHATSLTQDAFDRLYDPYGDSYTEPTSVEALRGLFASMDSSEYAKPDASDPKTVRSLWRQIAELENEYFPDESAQFGLFRLCDVYVAPTVRAAKLLGLRVRWKGGLVSSDVTPSTTHCVVDK